MADKDEIIYSINIEDIQTVAVNELERELSDIETEKIKHLIGEKISWYDAIADTINELFENEYREGNNRESDSAAETDIQETR